jgi:hypothetical protein
MEPRFKYPRSFHLPFSPGATNDDRILENVKHFEGKEVVVTVKMDGENSSLYRDGTHARSVSGTSHPSRDWLRGFHATFAHEIPASYRICGENLFAVHSIKYKYLSSWFQVFSIWNGDTCLSWPDTVDYCRLLGLETVPVLYEGVWDEKHIRSLASASHGGDPMEGYVVRTKHSFLVENFGTNLAKYVRPNHVQTDQHWKSKPIEVNRLKSG